MKTIRQRLTLAHEQDLLTVDEVALLTRYNPQTIYRKVWRDEIPGVVRVGRGVRFVGATIRNWARGVCQARTAAQ